MEELMHVNVEHIKNLTWCEDVSSHVSYFANIDKGLMLFITPLKYSLDYTWRVEFKGIVYESGYANNVNTVLSSLAETLNKSFLDIFLEQGSR